MEVKYAIREVNMQYKIYLQNNYMKLGTTKVKHATTEIKHEYDINMQ